MSVHLTEEELCWYSAHDKHLVATEAIVAYVRHLRSLVVRTVEAAFQPYVEGPTGDVDCLFCGSPKLEPHDDDCPWPELEAEARAIAQESKIKA